METFKMCSLILFSLHHGAKNDTYFSVAVVTDTILQSLQRK